MKKIFFIICFALLFLFSGCEQKNEAKLSDEEVTVKAENAFKTYYMEFLSCENDAEKILAIDTSDFSKLFEEYPNNKAVSCFYHASNAMKMSAEIRQTGNEDLKTAILNEVDAAMNGYDGEYSSIINNDIGAIDTKKLREQFEKDDEEQTNKIAWDASGQNIFWSLSFVKRFVKGETVTRDDVDADLIDKFPNKGFVTKNEDRILKSNITVGDIKFPQTYLAFTLDGVLEEIKLLTEDEIYDMDTTKTVVDELNKITGTNGQNIYENINDIISMSYSWDLGTDVGVLYSATLYDFGTDAYISIRDDKAILKDSKDRKYASPFYAKDSYKNLDAIAHYDNTNGYVSGSLTNNSNSTVYFIKVKIKLLNSNGQVVETDSTYACGDEGLEPGESTTFEAYVKENKDGILIELYE